MICKGVVQLLNQNPLSSAGFNELKSLDYSKSVYKGLCRYGDWVCNKSNTTTANSGAEASYSSGAPASPTVLMGRLMLPNLFCVVLCRSLLFV